jgi:prolyl-tRNA synthetase
MQKSKSGTVRLQMYLNRFGQSRVVKGTRIVGCFLSEHFCMQASSFEEFKEALAQKKRILAPWCDCTDVEVKVKETTKISKEDGVGEGGEAGAKTLCIPFEQPPMPEGQMCIFSKVLLGEDRPAKNFALWGRSY